MNRLLSQLGSCQDWYAGLRRCVCAPPPVGSASLSASPIAKKPGSGIRARSGGATRPTMSSLASKAPLPLVAASSSSTTTTTSLDRAPVDHSLGFVTPSSALHRRMWGPVAPPAVVAEITYEADSAYCVHAAGSLFRACGDICRNAPHADGSGLLLLLLLAAVASCCRCCYCCYCCYCC